MKLKATQVYKGITEREKKEKNKTKQHINKQIKKKATNKPRKKTAVPFNIINGYFHTLWSQIVALQSP